MTLTDLESSTQRLVRAVDRLSDDDYAAPSLLPGWTRGHVVAHLALNAEALAAAVRGAAAGEDVAMYASAESRDRDIDELAARSPSAVRDRLFGSATALAEALQAAAGPDLPSVMIKRTPGSDRTFSVGDVPSMRWREVEIHHVDLGSGHSPADWPEAFRTLLLDQLVGRASATLVATDLDRTWQGGAPAPVVSGTSADLGWWLTGRGTGEGLTSDGDLPRIEAW